MTERETSINQVAQQLQELGVPAAGVLVVHTSFRAVRPVEGGPRGLIAALRQALGSDGTLVMPTMSGSGEDEPYDPATTPTDNGVVADTFWRLPGVLRGDHPTSSFAAAGPLAAAITAPQPLEPVHGLDSPIGPAIGPARAERSVGLCNRRRGFSRRPAHGHDGTMLTGAWRHGE